MKISKYSRLLPLAVLPLVLAACPGERDVDDTWTDPALTTPPEEPRIEEREFTTNLDEVAGSGMTGEAHVRQVGAQTEIRVRIEDAGPNQTLQGGVHRGTCDMVGEQVASLQSITTDAEGRGEATSMVNIPGWTWDNGTTAQPGETTQPQAGQPRTGDTDRDFVIAYYVGQANGQPVVCGDLEDNGFLGL